MWGNIHHAFFQLHLTAAYLFSLVFLSDLKTSVLVCVHIPLGCVRVASCCLHTLSPGYKSRAKLLTEWMFLMKLKQISFLCHTNILSSKPRH